MEIIKYNGHSNNISNTLLIGDKHSNYPNAVGNCGSDNIISCGIDKTSNILYYIGSNTYNCPSQYNIDSSLVRVNLTDFSFIDRTIFNDFQHKKTFSNHNHYNYKYINAPSTSLLIDGDSLWLGFGTIYTIWRLNISSPTVELIDQYQKSYMTTK